MGEKLREFVECQLIADLNVYVSEGGEFLREGVLFDWSDSCVEGHRTSYLDGEVENFSGVAVYDLSNDLIAGGWMEFIETENGIKVFWWYLDAGEKYKLGVSETLCMRLSPCRFDGSFVEPFWV
ncbi:MAG: hypothetical protein HOM87_00705 [Proteobacteria bacterium]|jgi:hypothetical protein|nr:hypothetical protein [Pseudomonadota bacterium]